MNKSNIMRKKMCELIVMRNSVTMQTRMITIDIEGNADKVDCIKDDVCTI